MPILPYVSAYPSLEGLHYSSYGSPTAPTLLFLHGFSLRGDVFERMVPYLTPRYHVLAPDLRGCGRSDRMTPPFTIDQYVQDLVLLLDWLGIGRAHVVGFSMGGAVAQQLALVAPGRVETLSLVCSWAYKSQTPTEFVEHYFGPTAYRSVGNSHVLNHLTPQLLARMGLTEDPQLFRWYREVLSAYRDDVLLAGAEEVFRFDSRPWLRKLLVPTLVVSAEEDVIVPPYHGSMLTKGIPNAQLELVRNTGHALPFSHPSLLAGHLLEFFDPGGNSAPQSL